MPRRKLTTTVTPAKRPYTRRTPVAVVEPPAPPPDGQVVSRALYDLWHGWFYTEAVFERLRIAHGHVLTFEYGDVLNEAKRLFEQVDETLPEGDVFVPERLWEIAIGWPQLLRRARQGGVPLSVNLSASIEECEAMLRQLVMGG